MFNRDNLNRDSLFGSRPNAPRQSPQPPGMPQQPNYPRPQPGQQRRPQQYEGYDSAVPDNYPRPQPGQQRRPQQYEGYDTTMPDYSRPMRSPEPPERSQQDTTMRLRPEKNHGGNTYALANLASISDRDFPDRQDYDLIINHQFVVKARPHPQCQPGYIGLTDPQRTWARISLGPNETVEVQRYNIFSQGKQAYLGAINAEVGFASRRTVDTPLDQDELSDVFTRAFENHILAPGQIIIMDYKSLPLRFIIQTVQLVDLSMEDPDAPVTSDPDARGILTRQTSMTLFKDARTGINLKGSSRKPAANSILQPNFKFEDLGIGGLDAEFSMIFRKAFASRLFPPGLVQRMGIIHVRGILLYGPPGTGKTLIARRIGQMLNAREPKVINGPEVLNKYVGQSEENIRNLFADAEKEQKEKGDESGLHIIIFDELDAVCKQRGSGSTGGTGVGDSIVNQLLSKLDGVDQLNNILLIGMTNRKDMIDEALLRAGRLEVHIEISLPDEDGRVEILNIHTADMRKNNLLDPSVDIPELARRTKNYSGAEIAGLVRAAGSFAFSRNSKIGDTVQVNQNLDNFSVTRDDFMNALEETTPLFGVAEEQLNECLEGGILNFSSTIKSILATGSQDIKAVEHSKSIRMLNTILCGPPGSGKTALAAKLAIESRFPFVKLVTAQDMVGFTEMQKVNQLEKIFRDSDKSRLSVVVVDDIELLVDWNPIGPRFSNFVLSALKSVLKRKPPKDRRRMVFATTSERTYLRQLQLLQFFDGEIDVPNVQTTDELLYILKEAGRFKEQIAKNVIWEIQQNTKVEEEIRKNPEKLDGAVSIKRILIALNKAKEMGEGVAGGFVDLMIQEIRENRPLKPSDENHGYNDSD